MIKLAKVELIHSLESVIKGKRKTVVIIHGMASCALETKNLRRGGGWELAWASVEKISGAVMDWFKLSKGHAGDEWIESLQCRLVNSRDSNGKTITHTVCAEGWDVRPVHGLEGIFSSNPGEVVEIPLYKNLMELIDSINCNALACNYDWRLWGDYVYSDNWILTIFKPTIEKAYAMHNRKVDIVTHSLGGHVITYSLRKMEQVQPGWCNKYISQSVNIGPAIAGTVSMYGSFSVGPAVGIDVFPDWLNHLIADASSTWPCMAVELPNNMGAPDNSEGDPWREYTKPMAIFGGPGSVHCMKNKNYNMSERDVLGFLNDVKTNKWVPGRTEGPTLYKNACKMNRLCGPPPVRSHYILSSAKETVCQLQWKKDKGGGELDLGDMPEKVAFERGDGTVATKPMRTLFEYWLKQGADIHWHDVRDEYDVGHKSLIEHDASLAIVKRLISQT
jgi:hypothetical protein